MSIIQLYDNNEVSAELGNFLAQIKPNVDNYVSAKATAQRERMLIIGQINEYKNQYPQRSTDHRLLRQAMNTEWTDDVIKKGVAAFAEFKRLKETEVPEYIELAEAANPSQLVTLSRGVDTTLAYDAARHLKQTGSLPSKGKMEQYLQGHIKSDFSSRPWADTQKCPGALLNQKEVTPYVAPTPIQLSEEELELQRYGVTNEDTRRHILGLLKNTNLEHINTIKDAYLWSQFGGGSLQCLMPIIKQKLSQSKEFEVILRELLNHQVAIDVEAVVSSPAKPVAFDNAVCNGVRFRR
jgi:hypothetical protein